MRKLLIAGALGVLVSLLAVLFTVFEGSNGDSSAAQPVRRVGLMHVGTDHVPPALKPLKARLAELGWTEGKNIELIFRNLEPAQAEEQAREFVRERVDVIVAFEDQSIDAAEAATARVQGRIPVVFLHPSDPLRDGLAKSLSRPGGNLTGVFGPRDVVAKQLEVYQALVPRLRRVLTLVDPTDPRTERTLKEYQSAAAQLQRPLDLNIREASTAGDLKRIFRSLRPGEVDGAFLLSNNLRQNHSALTIELAKRARIPVQGSRKEWVEQGALFSYGIDLGPLGRAGARYIDSILRGTSPADLPPGVFAEAVRFAGETGAAVVHDFAYGDLVFDGRRPASFLAEPGAREVGVELFSMSKSYGMAGWRLGFVVGSAEIVARVELLQDHVRAGIFAPLQRAGIAALRGPQESVEERRRTYEARRDRVLAALDEVGARGEGTFFVWLRLPDGVTVERLVEEHRVALAPGEGFGERGRGHARLSLAVADETLDAGLERLSRALAAG